MLVENRETSGFLLCAAFVGLASLRDVYLGAALQRIDPLVVAITAFTLCTAAFLPWALARDRASLAALRRHPRTLLWINATTAIAWLSFFHALRAAEPALVQVVFFGIGPLTVRWIDRLVVVAPALHTRAERRVHVGLSGALVFAAVVMLGRPAGPGALALTVVGGIAISVSTLLCRVVNDRGVRPAALIALRFPGAAIAAAALAMVRDDALAGVTPGVLAGVALASLLLIVLPNFVNQIGVALASPLTVRAVLAAGPVLVFLLQAVEGRLPSSPYTLAACVLYAVFAAATALARRRAIAAPAREVPAPVPEAPASTR